MTEEATGEIPTRMIDFSAATLGDLERLDAEMVGAARRAVVRQVSQPSAVTLAGSNS